MATSSDDLLWRTRPRGSFATTSSPTDTPRNGLAMRRCRPHSPRQSASSGMSVLLTLSPPRPMTSPLASLPQTPPRRSRAQLSLASPTERQDVEAATKNRWASGMGGQEKWTAIRIPLVPE